MAPAAVALFALIFFWTPPHFWALALYRSDDYRRAGVPMLPVVAGLRETKRQMLLYTLVLVPVVYEFVDDFEQWLRPRLAKLITPRESALQPAPEDRL